MHLIAAIEQTEIVGDTGPPCPPHRVRSLAA
jgi:hypothetical protein